MSTSSGNNNCCGGGWDNDYHPVAGAMAVAAAVAVTSAVVGSMVNTVPANCVPVNYGGMVYQQCGSQWYQPQGSQYVVVNTLLIHPPGRRSSLGRGAGGSSVPLST